MIYTYIDRSPTNQRLESQLHEQLGAVHISGPENLLTLTQDDVVIFLNFENKTEFARFAKLIRAVVICRSVYVIQGINHCESIVRGHYTISLEKASVFSDLPGLISSYVEHRLDDLTNWRSRWK